MHTINAYIVRKKDFDFYSSPSTPFVNLPQNFVMFVPTTEEVDMTKCAIAEISTDYFGGAGDQEAHLWIEGQEITEIPFNPNPINAALKRLGLIAAPGEDEFDTANLGSYRDNGDITREWNMNKVPSPPLPTESYSSGKLKITLVHGDITKVKADAIVNAANNKLKPGSGVCGAIYKVAGLSELDAECKKIGRCSTGEAVMTDACNLKPNVSKIIHAVGPIYNDGYSGENILLNSVYDSCLFLAKVNQIKSIAFPAISTGIYGFPIQLATEIAVKSCVRFMMGVGTPEMEVIFVCFSESDFAVYSAELNKCFNK